MSEPLVPGTYVCHPSHPDWGIGQVQSVVGHRITVNFEHRGKQLIDAGHVTLVPAEPAPPPWAVPGGRG